MVSLHLPFISSGDCGRIYPPGKNYSIYGENLGWRAFEIRWTARGCMLIDSKSTP